MRVVLVDDQPLFRNGIASLLATRGHQVVGEAGDGQEALEVVRSTRPHLVLMDLRMPVLGGIESTRLLKSEMPETRIVILTVSDLEQDLVEAVKSGAHGYLLKDLEAEGFFDALAAIERGEPVISASLAGQLWSEFQLTAGRSPEASREEEGDGAADASSLTPREWEVLRLVAAGYRNREVAERLVVSENTVKFHMRAILDKLHLRNRTEVTAWVNEHARETYSKG